MSFDKEFDDAIKNITIKNEKVIRATAIQLFSAIVKSTPVQTGRLRGNWQTTLSTPATGTTTSLDVSGNKAISDINSVTGRFTLADDSIWFTNNLVYAEAIENGTRGARPYKMVSTNIALFVPLINQQANKESN